MKIQKGNLLNAYVILGLETARGAAKSCSDTIHFFFWMEASGNDLNIYVRREEETKETLADVQFPHLQQ